MLATLEVARVPSGMVLGSRGQAGFRIVLVCHYQSSQEAETGWPDFPNDLYYYIIVSCGGQSHFLKWSNGSQSLILRWNSQDLLRKPLTHVSLGTVRDAAETNPSSSIKLVTELAEGK